MEHLTLTETEFFRLISNPDSRTGLRTAYDEFTQKGHPTLSHPARKRTSGTRPELCGNGAAIP
ncbi:hypothetical protein [Phocaeicola dorei]|uniref:hypothetical protein n=1 Tax=Phocaeicola dorei TaxID=357276 RepID=UPI00211E5AAD|nr:hypothetical protein [Phocaeicola dorei]